MLRNVNLIVQSIIAGTTLIALRSEENVLMYSRGNFLNVAVAGVSFNLHGLTVPVIGAFNTRLAVPPFGCVISSETLLILIFCCFSEYQRFAEIFMFLK